MVNEMKKQDLKTGDIIETPFYYGIIQAMYGNRTGIEFKEENVDGLILGYIGSDSEKYWKTETDKLDRSMIQIPGKEGLVLLYNKYEEEKRLKDKEKYFQEDGYILKPLAEIPEIGVKLYSRCLACRVNKDGQFESLRETDCESIMKYLSM